MEAIVNKTTISKNQKLYNNMINSNRATIDEIGDYETFNTMLGDSINAIKLYQNLMNNKRFTVDEIGTQEEFLSNIDQIKPQKEQSGETPGVGYYGRTDEVPEQYYQSTNQQQTKFTQEDIDYANTMIPVIQEMKRNINKSLPVRYDLPNQLSGKYGENKAPLGYIDPESVGKGGKSKSRQSVVAGDLLDKTEGYLNAISKGDSNAAMRFVNGLKTVDVANLLSAGISGMNQSIDIYDAAKRYSEGSATDDDKNLLVASSLLQEIQQKAQNDRATSIGTGLADMAPWLVQFGLTGGIGTSATKATASALESLMAKNLMGKVAGNIMKGIAGTAAQTASQVPLMVQGTAERMTDKYQLNDGELQKTDEGKEFGEALGRTFANNFLEVYSERVFGDAVDKLGTKALSKVLDSKALANTKVSDIINSIRNNRYIKLTNKTLGLNTPLTENIEEAFTGLTQPFVTEDNLDEAQKQVQEYFSRENLIRVFLTTAAMGAGAGVLQAPGEIYHNAKSDKGKKIVDGFDQEQSDLWNQSLTAETIEERKDAWLNLWNSAAENGATKSELNSMMHYYQTALSEVENSRPTQQPEQTGSQQPYGPVSTGSTPQFTVNPRDTYAAEVRQTIEPLAHNQTGTLTVVQETTQPGEENKLWFVKVGSENDIDGSVLVEDEQGNQKFLTKEQLTGDPSEMTIEDFVSQKLDQYDQENAQNTNRSLGKMIFNNRLLRRSSNPAENRTADSEYWFDDQTEQEVEVPLKDVEAWEKQKQADPAGTPEVVSRVYGKTQVSGTRDQNGNILLSEPMNADQTESLRQEIEKATGGKSTIQAELIPNEDITLPDSYQLSIMPLSQPATEQGSEQLNLDELTAKQTENKQNVTTPPSQDNKKTENTAPKYTYKGNDISKEEAIRKMNVAADMGKANPIEYLNDPELDALSEKYWPKPKASFKVGAKKYTEEQAIDLIELADTPEELTKLKIENIEQAPKVGEALQKKNEEFERAAREAKQQAEEKAKAEKAAADEIHNKLVRDLNSFNSMTDAERRKTNTQPIVQQAANLGYLIKMDGTKLVVTENGKTIGYRGRNTPLETIESHKGIADYSPEIQETAGYFMSPMLLQDVYLNGMTPEEAKQAILDVQAGKKTVGANQLLDQIENIHQTGIVKIKANHKTGFPGAEIPIDEYKALINNDVTPEEESFAAGIPEDVALLISSEQLTPELLDEYEQLILPDNEINSETANRGTEKSLPDTQESQKSETFGEEVSEKLTKSVNKQSNNQINELLEQSESLQKNQLQNEESEKVTSESINKQVSDQPIYLLNGKEIDRRTAKARITAAILKENENKLSGLQIFNDHGLLSRIEKAFPNFNQEKVSGKQNSESNNTGQINDVDTGNQEKEQIKAQDIFDQIRSKVDHLTANAPGSAQVNVLRGKSELPEAIKNHKTINDSVQAVWHKGQIYILADKVNSLDEVVQLWIHENGIHNGLRNIIPAAELKLFMENVYNSFIEIGKNNPVFQGIIERVNTNYPDQSNNAKAEEYLAYLSEKIVAEQELSPMEQTAWKKYLDMFRDFLSKLFNFNSGLLTEKQITEITRFAVQSNYQENGLNGSTVRYEQSEIRLRKLSLQAKDNPFTLIDYLQSSSETVKQKKRLPQKVRTKVDRFASRFIDGNRAVQILLEKFDLKVPDYANVFLALNQKSSRQMGNKNEFERKFYNPMLRSVGKLVSELEKTGHTREDAYSRVKDYLVARHAPERNSWFKSLGKKGDNFSGMTDAQAIEIFEAMERIIPREMINELWVNVRKCTHKISSYWVEYGKYSQGSLDAIMNRNWEYYVPLRGFEPVAEDIELDYEHSEKRSDFAGNEKTEGRESRSDDPIVYIYQMANSAIMWGEKNKAKRSAYNLIKLNSARKDLFEMASITFMTDKIGLTTEVVLEPNGTYHDKNGKEHQDHKVYLMAVDNNGQTKKTELGNKSQLLEDGNKFSVSNSAGLANSKPSYLRKQHEVDVYIDGSKFKMIFKDPAISNAINGDNYSQAINFKYLPLASITRFLSRGVTSWSPSFITKNTYRDFRTGSTTMFIQRGFKDSMKFQAKYKDAARFLASNLLNDAIKDSVKTDGNFLKLLSAEPKTEDQKKWKIWYDEFNLNGGPTGHSYLMPLDEVRSKVEQYINKIKRSKSSEILSLANPLNALKALENLAGYGENIARFTAYVMARERGESIIKSINDAKEITTNFDTRGEYSATIGSFIMFFNASIQGAAKQYNLAKNHPFRYFVVKALSLVVQGLLCRYLWDLMNGEDEEKDYAEINKYTMYNNTVIGWKDNYVTIPLPQGYRVWNALGAAIYEHHTGKLSTEQMAFDMAEMFSTAISPVDLVGIFDRKNKLSYPKIVGNLFSPIRPIMDLSINEDFKNSPIYREPFLSNRESRFADSQMYLNRTNSMLISFTDWMYKMGGGDTELGTKTISGKRIQGIFDWNPAKIEYILKSYSGGPGQTVLDAANYLILKSIDDVDKRIKDKEHQIEGFDPTSIPILQSYYHKKYTGFMYDEYRELANEAELLKTESKRRENSSDPEKMFGMPVELDEFIMEYDITNSLINELLDLKKDNTDDELLKAVDLQILGLRREFVSKYKYFKK